MSHSISIRRAAVAALVAALVAGALLATMSSAASAAIPRAGYYNGTTVQADQTPGTVGFKVFKYGSFNGTVRKVLSVSATTQLKCASGEVKEDRYLVYIILGGQINKYGKFKYVGNGFTIKGRFGTKTSARGTLSRKVGDCAAENVSWSAKRSTGGIPIP
jgi:hypothetical protein